MSRVAKSPIDLPDGVDVQVADGEVVVKKGSDQLKVFVNRSVLVSVEDGQIKVQPKEDDKPGRMHAGTVRANINNAVVGVSAGFQKQLKLVGVGYRVQAKGNTLNLSLGFSHPVEYKVHEDVTVESPSQTEIILKSANKQLLGQCAAEIRAFRPPEPYKGKGVRYSDEEIRLKEAKKK